MKVAVVGYGVGFGVEAHVLGFEFVFVPSFRFTWKTGNGNGEKEVMLQ